jgi:hypothetical protein
MADSYTLCSMRRPVQAAFLALTTLLGAAVNAAALPKVLTQEHSAFQVRPAVISYTGDGTGIVGGPNGTSVHHLGHLRWTTYNRRFGIATGLVWLDDCSPDCARGTFTAHHVHVLVFSPHHRHFRRLTLRYRYRGRRYVDRRFAMFYRGSNGIPGYWAYAICGTRFTPRC